MATSLLVRCRRGLVSALLLAALLAPRAGAETAERRRERFNAQTVMLTVTDRDQQVRRGAGVVLCQEEGEVYVVTAWRLLAGAAAGEGETGRSSLRRPARTEIRFHDGIRLDGRPPEPFVDERAAGPGGLTFHQAPEAGVVLVSFPYPELPWTAATRRGFFEIAGSTGIFRRRRPPVSAIGHPGSSGSGWARATGELLAGDGRWLHHSVPMPEGFLGAPLFNQRFLIGLHVGGESGEALSVHGILTAIGKWLPARCQESIGWRAESFPREAEGESDGETGGETARPAAPELAPGLAPLADPADGPRLARALQAAISERAWLEVLSAFPERFESRTVMITVTRGERVEQGAGAVLCEEDGEVALLTAHHVLAGKEGGEGGTDGRDPDRLEIQFFGQSVPGVVATPGKGGDAVTVHPLPALDLALLLVPARGEPVAMPSLVRSPAWARAQLPPAVLALGHRKAPLESWAREEGILLPGEGGHLRHSAALAEGFSGGPLFDASGVLLGINLERVVGGRGGEGGEEVVGEAVAIEEILPSIRPWLPEGCARTLESALATSPVGLEATAFLAAAEKLEVSAAGRELRFGPHRIRDVRGGTWRQIFSSTRATRTFRFSVELGDEAAAGTHWRGECRETVEVAAGGGDRISESPEGVAVDTSLRCSFEEPGGGEGLELLLDEHQGPEGSTGAGALGGMQIEAATGGAVSYLLHTGGRILGAIGEAEGVTVWLDRRAGAEARTASALAAAALLLRGAAPPQKLQAP